MTGTGDMAGDSGGRPPAAGPVGPAEAAEEANTRFYEAVEHGDLDAMGEVWLENGDGGESITCVHAGWPVLRGRPEVLRSFALIMANTDYIQFFLTDVEVELLGEEVAVVTCTENILSGEPGEPDEQGPGPLVGGTVVATNVFRRSGGAWRLQAHHGSPVLLGEDEDGDGEPPTEPGML
jgi:ketosteroid isomerase-like protein